MMTRTRCLKVRTVSNLNKKIYAKIEVWRNRRIEGEHHFRCLPRPDGKRRGVPPEARWQRCAFLPERLQPRASDQGPRGEPYAQGYPCSGELGSR